MAKEHKQWFVFSDSAKRGGVGEILSGFLQENNISDVSITSFEYTDEFIAHGATNLVEDSLKISAKEIAIEISKKISL